jgi:hypothetical protein
MMEEEEEEGAREDRMVRRRAQIGLSTCCFLLFPNSSQFFRAPKFFTEGGIIPADWKTADKSKEEDEEEEADDDAEEAGRGYSSSNSILASPTQV